jgi:hypothetical protein
MLLAVSRTITLAACCPLAVPLADLHLYPTMSDVSEKACPAVGHAGDTLAISCLPTTPPQSDCCTCISVNTLW